MDLFGMIMFTFAVILIGLLTAATLFIICTPSYFQPRSEDAYCKRHRYRLHFVHVMIKKSANCINFKKLSISLVISDYL